MLCKKNDLMLVVEDNVAFRRFVVAALEEFGLRVVEARDGDEGLARFKSEKPDCVLTDIYMPSKDGIELVVSLRELDTKVEIVVMSGKGKRRITEPVFDTLREIGVNHILTKPFRLGELKSLFIGE